MAGGPPNPYVSSYELSPNSATQGGRARPNGEKFNPWSFLANFFFSNMNFAIADPYRHGKARADNFLNKFEILGLGFFWGSGGSMLGFLGVFLVHTAVLVVPTEKSEKKNINERVKVIFFLKLIDMTRAFPLRIAQRVTFARLMPILRHLARYGLKMAKNDPFLTHFGHFLAPKIRENPSLTRRNILVDSLDSEFPAKK